jgi:preprotein translocase subunit SecE
MASKAAVVKSEERSSSIKRQEPNAVENFSGNVVSVWGRFTGFLSDVRSEVRKVVAPSRKEVQSTTTVVILTVFIFGFFFWVTDLIFSNTVQQIVHRLAGE